VKLISNNDADKHAKRKRNEAKLGWTDMPKIGVRKRGAFRKTIYGTPCLTTHKGNRDFEAPL